MKNISNEEIIFMILSGDLKSEYDWINLIENYQLSEEQIDKYWDKLDCAYISAYQKLSNHILKKYKDDLDWFGVFDNPNTTLIQKIIFFRYSMTYSILKEVFTFAIFIFFFYLISK